MGFGFYPIISLSPSTVPQNGGQLVTLSGTFPTDVAVYSYIGQNEDETDEPCYGATKGNGYDCWSLDGLTLEIVTPPLLLVGSQYVTIQHYYGWDSIAVTVIEHMYTDTLYEIRKNWPIDFNTGPRDMRYEPEQS